MKACLNCDTKLPKGVHHCHACGQKVNLPALRMQSLLVDFFDNIFNIDNKLWRTARDIWKPGRLARSYVEGKRKRYTSPVRLFIFTLFTFFTISVFMLKSGFNKIQQQAVDKEKEVWQQQIIAHFDSIAPAAPFPVVFMPALIDNNTVTINGVVQRQFVHTVDVPVKSSRLSGSYSRQLGTIINRDSISNFNRISDLIDSLVQVQVLDTNLSVEGMTDGKFQLSMVQNAETNTFMIFGIPIEEYYTLTSDQLVERYGTDSWWSSKMIVQQQKALQNADTALRFLVGNGVWVVAALIVFMALLFFLLYYRQNYLYAEHFIFQLYEHARISLLMILALVLIATVDLGGFLFAVVMLVSQAYLLLSMKWFYEQEWFATFVKWIIAIVAHLILSIICAVTVLGVSFLVL